MPDHAAFPPVPVPVPRTGRELAFSPRSIAVIGSGVVGTATGLGFAAKGYHVRYYDVSIDRVQLLRSEGLQAYPVEELRRHFTDAYLLSVPTPTVDGRVDLSFLTTAARALAPVLADHAGWPLVVVRSTVPPGTTGGLIVPLLERGCGRRAGEGFGICMNPEFLRAATAEEDFLRPRLVVIGAPDHRSAAALARLYRPWSDVPTLRVDLVTAEATKYTSNLFNALKISFFNEMHAVLGAIGADAAAAFDAVAMGAEGMWNPLYGTRGGAPYGGVCLPKDTVGFLGFARDRGIAEDTRMLQATITVNDRLLARGSRPFEPRPAADPPVLAVEAIAAEAS